MEMKMFMFLAMFMGLVLAAKAFNAPTATVSGAEIITGGCSNVNLADRKTDMVANYYGKLFNGATACGKEFTLKNGDFEMTVLFVGECSDCPSDIVVQNVWFGDLTGNDPSITLVIVQYFT